MVKVEPFSRLLSWQFIVLLLEIRDKNRESRAFF
jgi:hypothetical protein